MNTHNNIFIYTEANIISILFQINDVLKFMGTLRFHSLLYFGKRVVERRATDDDDGICYRKR